MAHSFLNPGQPEYRDIEAQLPHYEYDPRRASQLIEGLGYSRGSDASFRDRTGQRLEVEILSGPQDSLANAAAAIADYWQQIGVRAPIQPQTQRLAQDLEALATFPGFSVENNPQDVVGLRSLHSSRARLPENSFQVPGPINRSRYMNSELDRLVDAYFRTILEQERISVLGRIIRHVAEQLPVMGIYYGARPEVYAHRLVHVSPRWSGAGTGTNPAWNAHEWDVRS